MPLSVGIVPPPDLVRRYTSLDLADRLHLERLMASWSLLADFSFSDLLLFVPTTRDDGDGDDGPAGEPAGSGAGWRGGRAARLGTAAGSAGSWRSSGGGAGAVGAG